MWIIIPHQSWLLFVFENTLQNLGCTFTLVLVLMHNSASVRLYLSLNYQATPVNETRDRCNSIRIIIIPASWGLPTLRGEATPNNPLVQFYTFHKGQVTAMKIGRMGTLASSVDFFFLGGYRCRGP